MTPRNRESTPNPQPWPVKKSSPIDKQSLRTEGERRRDRGMELAAEHNPCKVKRLQLAFLNQLLKSPNQTATIDDVTENLAAEFMDGGSWRGAAINGLARRKVIEEVGWEKSNRPSRHSGENRLWRIADKQKAITLRARLKAAVECRSDTTSDKSKTPSATFGEASADDVSNLNATKDSSTPTNQED